MDPDGRWESRPESSATKDHADPEDGFGPADSPFGSFIVDPAAEPPKDKHEELLETPEWSRLWALRKKPRGVALDIAIASIALAYEWTAQEVVDLLIHEARIGLAGKPETAVHYRRVFSGVTELKRRAQAEGQNEARSAEDGDRDMASVLVPGTHVRSEKDCVEQSNGEFARQVLAKLPRCGILRRAGIAGELVGTPRVFRELSADRLRVLIEEHARLVRWRQREQGSKSLCSRVSATRDHANLVLACALDSPSVSELRAIAACPQLLADGRILDKEGFDPQSGIYLDFAGSQFHAVPVNPTRETAMEAMQCVYSLLGAGFPFADPAVGWSALFALLLTGVGRSAIPGPVPMFAVDAPTRASGKSTAARLAALLATGSPPVVLDADVSDEEFDKRATSVLLSGARFVSYDNCIRVLDSAALCRMVSEPRYGGRRLGTNEVLDLPTDSLTITATGVGLTLGGDVPSRSVRISLDRQLEHAATAPWKYDDPTRAAVDHRGELVPKLLTILRAHQLAGQPSAPGHFRFEEWNRAVRGCCCWLELADPLTGLEDYEEHTPAAENLAALHAAWSAAFGREAVTVAKILEASAADSALRAVLVTIAGDRRGEVDGRRFGDFLRRKAKQVVIARNRIVRRDGKRVANWALESVETRA